MALLVAGCLAAAVTSFFATGLAVRLLTHWSILDHPNRRSSHQRATPRGGGLAVVPVILVAWTAVALQSLPVNHGLMAVCLAALGLAVVSWVDDVKGLSASLRLGVQILAVLAIMIAAPFDGLVFAGLLPAGLDRALTAVLWLWFINVFNFMDGIDGIAATQTAAIGIGVAAVTAASGGGGGLAPLGALVATAALGFLPWNWHPARLFLGDVGSIPLGFLLGWLLLSVAAEGHPIAALILPLYYLIDASWTLASRLLRGEKPWEAHREHLYQRAVVDGFSHSTVTGAVALACLALIAMAVVAASGRPGLAAAGACLAVATLIMFLARARKLTRPRRCG